jgi:hypothetical protein
MKRKDDGIDVHGKAPGFWFYPADYERDVAPLSLAAQGLWVRMLCRMHFAKRRGYLEHANGAPVTPEDLARMVGSTTAQVTKLIAEMDRIELFSRDENGVIHSRRMVRDAHISDVRKQAALARLQGAHRSDAGTFAPAKTPAKPEQNTVLSSSSSFSPSGCISSTTELAPANRPDASMPGAWAPSWHRCISEYPGVWTETDARLFFSLIETPAEEHVFFDGLAAWVASKQWQEGFIPKLENFLSKRLYKSKPPVPVTRGTRNNNADPLEALRDL